MTTPRLDPLATQHDGTPDSEHEGPEDPQTARLRDENRALRELLAAQVQASIPRPSLFKRLGWALISAPGAALVGWRSLIGREDATPITGKRVGYATLTVLYTLAIYGALVLLVVSWSTPNAARTGVHAAGPVRVPLDAPQGAGQEPASPAAPTDWNSGDGAATPPRKPSRPRPGAGAAWRTPGGRPGNDRAGRRRRQSGRAPRHDHGRQYRAGPGPRPRAGVYARRAQADAADHRDPRRESPGLARQPEDRAGALRVPGLFRPPRLRLGRAQAILRPQPGLGRGQGMPAAALMPAPAPENSAAMPQTLR
ncbi:hypothetical protein [Achromobacter xylosoxidans]|uniref:hypothetical protein n=1 Tax=Alcaligenes xylosoxydans xylosoxydans TaxID=85698 RepID=UPI000AF833C7